MQAVILAGGMGTRLKPLTDKIPKVMVPVNGKPFLWHLLKLLESQGIGDIILCIGYLGKQVKDFFGNGGSLGMRIRYSEETERLLGTGGALKQSQNLLDDHFFVINGDTYLPVDYEEVERSFMKRGKKALIVVYDNREHTGVRNNVELDDALMVIRHDKESSDLSLEYVEAGVLAFKREVLDLMEQRGPVSIETGLYPTLIQQGELAAYVAGQRFYDIGTPSQQGIFEVFLERRAR
ncbi:sugar phosphate nucleotidyltransferase [Chloroflexota bacterium]